MKKGFTLIELLAVIVILAIIAVIAVPIVLNIIDESKDNATLISARFYLDALELSILQAALMEQNVPDGTYNILESGNICLEYTDTTCTNELEVEVNGDVPTSGTITIENGNISSIDFILSEKRIVKNENGDLVYQETASSPCTLQDGYTANTIGAKYECEVSPGVKYNFYVLSYNDVENKSTNDKTLAVTTNLIMDRNMCNDATSTAEGKICAVAWYENTWDNTYGPITAMTYLYNVTKSWVNIPSLNYVYNDKEFHETTSEDYENYTSFISNDGVATITAKDGTTTTTIGSKTEPLKARMPIYSYSRENGTEYGEVAAKTDANAYLFENLPADNWEGYWTLSSDDTGVSAWQVGGHGEIEPNSEVNDSYQWGVRPVITLKI